VQIGVPQRLVVIDLSKDGEERQPLFMANPEIMSASEALSDYEEGCLSIPEFYEMVTRPSEVKVRYLNRQGEPHELSASGVLATCVQHEIPSQRCPFIDYISAKARPVVKKFVKAQSFEARLHEAVHGHARLCGCHAESACGCGQTLLPYSQPLRPQEARICEFARS
jgi:peptide deformylase